MVKKFDRVEKARLAASICLLPLSFSTFSLKPTIQLSLTRSTKRNKMVWARMLAYIAGTVDQELLLRNEYLAAENRILKAQIKGRLLLSEADKATLVEIARTVRGHATQVKFAFAERSVCDRAITTCFHKTLPNLHIPESKAGKQRGERLAGIVVGGLKDAVLQCGCLNLALRFLPCLAF